MDESQAVGQNPERQINLQLITFSLAIGIVAFAFALIFVFQGHYSLSKFLKIVCVVFLIATPMVFAPSLLMLRNSLLNLLSHEQLLEVVLSTRAMKRLGFVLLSIPVVLFIYIAFLEKLMRGTWLLGAVQIALALFLAWSFTSVMILEVRHYERRHFPKDMARIHEFSLGRFVLKLMPSLMPFMTVSLSFFIGLYCAIALDRILFLLLGVLVSVAFFLVGLWCSKRLAAQFAG